MSYGVMTCSVGMTTNHPMMTSSGEATSIRVLGFICLSV
jgi:hypothetical protein